MRVIAGTYRSRPLSSIQGLDLRPTTDRLRETLFDVLTAGNPSALGGSIWIDLFAGTGAVGIEALSRGASAVYFVESGPKEAALIRTNIDSLGISAGFQILRMDALRGLQRLESEGVAADYIFLDPPYRMEAAYRQTLEAISRSPVKKAGSVIIAEHSKRFDPGEEFGEIARDRKLQQGDAALSFYRQT